MLFVSFDNNLLHKPAESENLATRRLSLLLCDGDIVVALLLTCCCPDGVLLLTCCCVDSGNNVARSICVRFFHALPLTPDAD